MVVTRIYDETVFICFFYAMPKKLYFVFVVVLSYYLKNLLKL